MTQRNALSGCNREHDAAHPAEKNARSCNVRSPDVGWGPVVMWSMTRGLRSIIGSERVNSNIEAQMSSWIRLRRL